MLRKLTLLSILASLAAPFAVEADTVAHWRFENDPGHLADSSGNGHTLTNNGGVTQAAATGFPSVIPQTGEANASASSFSGSNWLSAADNSAFTSNTFTLEAYFNAAATTGTRIIAGQQYSGGNPDVNQRSYFIAVAENVIRVHLSPTGGNQGNRTLNTSLTVSPDKVYYTAMVVDVPNNAVTVYLQNITDGGSLASHAYSGNDVPNGIHNSTGPFTIGATATGGSPFTGTIDEVRLSNVALPADQLLVVIPEPASLALVSLGALAMLRRPRG